VLLRGNFDHDDRVAIELDPLDPHGHGRPGLVGDQGGQLVGIGRIAMPRPRAGDAAIVFDADQEIGRFIPAAIGQAHNGFHQIAVVERSSRLALELDGERLACRDQAP
jgi:hypothetical protein